MVHQSIVSLKDTDQVDSVYLIKDVEKGKTSQGKSFARFLLKDGTGTISAIIWELSLSAPPKKYIGTFIRINGLVKANYYNGLHIVTDTTRVQKVGAPNNIGDYVPIILDSIIKIYIEEISEIIKRVEDRFIRTILNYVYNQENSPDLTRLVKSPHIYYPIKGGLLEHLLYGAKCVYALNNAYGASDSSFSYDFAIGAWLLHELDTPSMYREESWFIEVVENADHINYKTSTYSRIQQLYIAVESILREEIPQDVKNKLNHCILACLGQIEPRIKEAKILKIVEDLEGSLHEN